MKKGMPLVYLAGVGVFVFFLYALVNIGMDVSELIANHRGTLANVLDVGLRFLNENKSMLAVTAAVMVVAKFFAKAPGPARLE